MSLKFWACEIDPHCVASFCVVFGPSFGTSLVFYVEFKVEIRTDSPGTRKKLEDLMGFFPSKQHILELEMSRWLVQKKNTKNDQFLRTSQVTYSDPWIESIVFRSHFRIGSNPPRCLVLNSRDWEEMPCLLVLVLKNITMPFDFNNNLLWNQIGNLPYVICVKLDIFPTKKDEHTHS